MKRVKLSDKTRRGLKQLLDRNLRKHVEEAIARGRDESLPRGKRMTVFEEQELLQALGWIEQEVRKIGARKAVGDTGADGDEAGEEADPNPVPQSVGQQGS